MGPSQAAKPLRYRLLIRRPGVQVSTCLNLTPPAAARSVPSLPHHEVSADIGLEDLVEGALGEGAAVEAEELSHVSQAFLVVARAEHGQWGSGVVRGRFPLRRARRVEHLPHLRGDAVAGREAGVGDGARVALRLRQGKRESGVGLGRGEG